LKSKLSFDEDLALKGKTSAKKLKKTVCLIGGGAKLGKK